jgi:hypothetical protein
MQKHYPTPEEVTKLYKAALKARPVKLNDVQAVKLRYACYKVMTENAGNTMSDHVKAALVYLDLILNTPNLEF